jgi:hypothetical protein
MKQAKKKKMRGEDEYVSQQRIQESTTSDIL